MESDTKSCPYCAETIKAAAIKCRYCGSDLSEVGTSLGADLLQTASLSLRPMAAQAIETVNEFEIGVTYTEIVPAAMPPFHFLGVSGDILNTSDRPWSFHVGLFAGVNRHGVNYSHGLPGLTDTPVVQPGSSAQWGLRIPLPAATPPTVLGYHVKAQTSPGQIEVASLDMLDTPEVLGGMQHIMAAQISSMMEGYAAQEMNFANS